MRLETTTYGKLRDGDEVCVQGYWFRARNVRIAERGTAPRFDVIRFEGDVVDAEADIKGTGYDGGTYGGFAWVGIAVRRQAPGVARKMTLEEFDGELELIREALASGQSTRREAELAVADLKRRAGRS